MFNLNIRNIFFGQLSIVVTLWAIGSFIKIVLPDRPSRPNILFMELVDKN